jgi:hypothetical protein
MTSDELAQKLFSLVSSPEQVLLLAAKKDGGFLGFEPISVTEEDGIAVILLDPVRLDCEDCENCGKSGESNCSSC